MENSPLLIFYIISFVIVVCIYIALLTVVLKFDRCMVFAFMSTLLVGLLGSGLIHHIFASENNNSSSRNYALFRKEKENFLGSKDYYDNYYTKGIYAQGKEKYDVVGGQKDFELYKQYLREQEENPKMYEYPNYEVYPDTTYKVDIRNRQTVRDQKITKHQRHKEMDSLLDSAFNTQTNDYFDFYYNSY